jgi:hypothetical protein
LSQARPTRRTTRLAVALTLTRGARFASPFEHTLLLLNHQLSLGWRQIAQVRGDRADIAATRILLQRTQAFCDLIARQQLELNRDLAEQPVLRMHPAA